LGEVPYLFLDARYEKVRLERRIVDCAVLIAVGIEASGKRRVLGCEIATSEAEINWRRFLESLLARGLKGVKLIVADDSIGAQSRPTGGVATACLGSAASSICNRTPGSS
jgi:transposase-like protein